MTTHSHLLTNEEMGGISEVIEGTVAFDLLEFDTELDFSNKIRFVNYFENQYCIRKRSLIGQFTECKYFA